MSAQLPNGWVEVPLGQIAETALGKMLDSKTRTGEHQVPYLRNVNVQWGRIGVDDLLYVDIHPDDRERFGVRQNDLLVCEGGDVGRCAIWRSPDQQYVAFQKALHRIRPYGGISPHYLRYLLEYLSIKGELAARATGSTIKHLPQERLRELPVPLPPIDEQHRIVSMLEDHLSRIDAALGDVAVNRRRIPQLMRGVYTEAVEGRFIATDSASDVAKKIESDRIKRWQLGFPGKIYRAPVKVADSAQPLCPRGWHLASLDALTDPVRSIRYGILMPSVQSNGTVPYIEVRDLRDNSLAGKHLKRTSAELDLEFAKARVKNGDIVIAVRGSYERSAIVDIPFDYANLSRDVARIAPLRGVLPRYLQIYLQAEYAQSFLRRHARGVAVKGVNIASLKSMPVVIPDEAAQKLIVESVAEKVEAIQLLAASLDRATIRGGHLRRSLLQSAFSGRLVPPNPADEPVSDLLARIRIEKDGHSKVKQPLQTRVPRPTTKVPTGIQEELPL